MRGLRDDFPHHRPEIDVEPLAAGDFQAARVEAELVQEGGVQVGDVVPFLHGVEANRRCPIGEAPPVTAGRRGSGGDGHGLGALSPRSAAELGAMTMRVSFRGRGSGVFDQSGVSLTWRRGCWPALRPPCASQAPAPPLLRGRVGLRRVPARRGGGRRALAAEGLGGVLIEAVNFQFQQIRRQS